MNKFIAYCGLNCEKCEAYIATKNDDNDLRIKVAKEWSEMNQAQITPEMINCEGCRMDGIKFPYCGSMCEIRQCGMAKELETCGGCKNVNSCEKVAMVIGNNEEARNNLHL